MENSISWGWLAGTIITVLGTATGYLLSQKDRKQECEIKSLQKKGAEQDLTIQHLEDKLWSEDKLTQVIVDAVTLSITQIENKWLKEGLLHKHPLKK